ncbi:MAG: enoyl-CoA hydratase [Pseudohongiellaceae bacterium]|jgi:enoyl-CoA hydratase
MELVSIVIEDKIAKIALNNGKVNAISHQVIDELNAALDQAEEAKAVVILSGKEGILSGGYDLKTMQKSMTDAMALVTEGSKFTRRMMSFPFPIIVACAGHAVAKGGFILLSADYRIGVEGPFKIGLNEVAIGMTMHHAGIEMARNRIPTNYFNRSVMNAEMFSPKEAISAGFLDQIVAPEQLMATAEQVATQMKTLNMRAHHGTKIKARQAYFEIMDKAIEIDSTGSL